jgi:hypothetical protein
LTTENIAFTDIDVSLTENDDEYNQLCKITKSDEVPVVMVGKQILVPNVSFNTIAEGFELAKKLLSEK